ncbi:MAG: Maf family protein [Clostridiales bacterium]|nr:Maf family protein [Clostridiales bacterium]
MKNIKWILASKSPRRKELLSLVINDFEIEVSDVEEIYDKIKPEEIVLQLARLKGEAVFFNHKEDNVCVIASDTIVSIGDKRLGKPSERTECYEMIRSLSGNVHQVCTGVYIKGRINGKQVERIFSDTTDVYVRDMSDDEIYSYINEGESFDKAGGYAIQGGFSKFIEKINGSYHNVVGLPVHKVYTAVKELENLCK